MFKRQVTCVGLLGLIRPGVKAGDRVFEGCAGVLAALVDVGELSLLALGRLEVVVCGRLLFLPEHVAVVHIPERSLEILDGFVAKVGLNKKFRNLLPLFGDDLLVVGTLAMTGSFGRIGS